MSNVKQIPVDIPTVYAFEISGKIDADDMEAMAKTMNTAFDAHPGKVDLMLVFTEFDGSELGASFDVDVIRSRFRALSNVDKYVVVGAPASAEAMLNLVGKLIAVEPHTFDETQINQAWELLSVTEPGIAS